MKLWGISDLHVGQPANRRLLETCTPHPDDWLLLGGDLGETLDHLEAVITTLKPRFERLVWIPGNHELWDSDGVSGQRKYEACLSVCERHGVLTPEDDYVRWPGDGPRTVIAPLFLLYDYSFAPDEVGPDRAVAWAAEDGIVCADERALSPTPWPSRAAWCHARVEQTQKRLDMLPPDTATVLFNHFPLRRDLVFIPRIPRFVPWCGTRATEAWHQKYRARVCVSGHLHVRTTRLIDGVRFEEVSLGYTRQWDNTKTFDHYLREILPGPPQPRSAYHR